MSENKTKLKVISNEKLQEKEFKNDKIKKHKTEMYQTNPFYERLIKFSNEQKHRKFSVEDLLKW